MTVKQISVFVENKEGKLAEFTDILAQHGVDMRACPWRTRGISESCV